MDPALVALILKLAPVVLDGVSSAVRVKAVLSSEDEALVESAYRDFTAKRNALSDRLRSTPDDLG